MNKVLIFDVDNDDANDDVNDDHQDDIVSRHQLLILSSMIAFSTCCFFIFFFVPSLYKYVRNLKVFDCVRSRKCNRKFCKMKMVKVHILYSHIADFLAHLMIK